MIADWSSRARSVAAWSLGGALAAAGGFTAPLLLYLRVGNTSTAVTVACLVGAAGVGVGGYLAASARAGTAVESGAPRVEGLAWAGAFLVAAALVFLSPPVSSREEFAKPGDVNAITLPPPGAYANSSGHSSSFSPLLVRFFQAVLLFGSLGGVASSIAGARRRSASDLGRSVLAGLAWMLAAVVAAVTLISAGSVLGGGFGRLFMPISSVAGFVLGSVIAGGLAGGLAGAIGELARPISSAAPAGRA